MPDSGTNSGTGSGTADADEVVRSAADPRVVGPWLAAQLGDRSWAECTVQRVGAGRSNLTFRVSSAAGDVVLRRPPQGAVAATAHDMGREQTVLRGLADTPVPVPRVLADADADGPLGAPFYVMELVDGVIPVDTLPTRWADGAENRRRLTTALLDGLAELHGVDYQGAGLGDFGLPEGFLSRQLRRWGKQWDTWREGQDRPELTELAAALQDQMPRSPVPAVVHGDYRLDNAVFDRADPGRLLAVLDWEMSTLGDPLTDLGVLLVHWHQHDDEPAWAATQVLPSVTKLPEFPSRVDVLEYYARRTGIDVTPIGWYTAFGCFKLAVILAGIVARAQAGAMPADTATGLAEAIDPTARLGLQVLRTGLR